jgi:hypothetical protein
VWIGGHWGVQAGRHVWLGGRWERRVESGPGWVDGRWVNEGGQWVYYDVYWTPVPAPEAPVITVQMAPPPRPAEIAPPSPGPGYFWVHGEYVWNGQQYQWAPGHWETSRPEWVWVPARWVRQGPHWRFQPGRWQHR